MKEEIVRKFLLTTFFSVPSVTIQPNEKYKKCKSKKEEAKILVVLR
jgi:hypothetical protein